MALVPLTKDYLLEYFYQAETKKDDWKIGLEQEVFGYDQKTNTRLPYDRIKYVLEGFAKLGWEEAYEGELLIALKKDKSTITLEPGGQLELSTAPYRSIWEIQDLLLNYQKQLHEISHKLELEWFSLGYDPVSKIDEIPWMPKERYQVMGQYLPQFGDRVHHMMIASCGAQSNYDYSSEEDMRKKLTVTTAFSPIANILFATSPVRMNKFSGQKSQRGWAWRGIDPARTGILDFVFQEDFGYQEYIDYALQVPMLVIDRDDRPINFGGFSFPEFMANGHKGYTATQEDWHTQLGATFPVARLKNALETRSTDAGPMEFLLAQAAYWKGLLYSEEVLDQAYAYALSIGKDSIQQIHSQAAEKGFEIKIDGIDVGGICEKLLFWSKKGLKTVSKEQGIEDESSFLTCLDEIVNNRQSLADSLIKWCGTEDCSDIFTLLRKKSYSFA